jgi:hypothetical protein
VVGAVHTCAALSISACVDLNSAAAVTQRSDEDVVIEGR